MAVNWGMQNFQPRTQLDLSPIGRAVQQSKQNSLADLTLDAAEREQKLQKEDQEIMKLSRGNPQVAMNMYRDKGRFDKVQELQTGIAKQQKAQFEQRQNQIKMNQDLTKRQGQLAATVLNSEDPAKQWGLMRQTAINERLPNAEGWPEQYDENVGNQLKFMHQNSLTPEQRIAINKAKKSGLTKQEIDFKDREFKLKNRKLDFDIKKFDSEVNRETEGMLPQEKAVVIEEKLRNSFIKQNVDYVKVSDAYNRVLASGTESSAAGDLALIFNYMKMLDPGSTVREGEFATAASSGDLGDRFVGIGLKLLRGERLSPAQRKDFMARSKKLMKASQTGFNYSRNQYSNLAKRNKVSPENVTIDVGRGTYQPVQPSNVYKDPEKEKRYQMRKAEKAAERRLNK